MKQYVYHHVFIKCSAVRRPPSAVRRPPSAVRRPPSVVRRPSSVVRRPPSAVRRPVRLLSTPVLSTLIMSFLPIFSKAKPRFMERLCIFIHIYNKPYISLWPIRSQFDMVWPLDLARAPRRARLTARKKGSGYENVVNFNQFFIQPAPGTSTACVGTRASELEPGDEAAGLKRPYPNSFSYPEPFLRAVRRGALAKSITGYHKNMVRKQCPVLELANQMPVRNMDLARAPRRTARKKGSGYENDPNWHLNG